MEKPTETLSNDKIIASNSSGMPIWIQILGLCITVVSIIYCLNARTWEEIIKYVSYVASGLFIVFFLIIVTSVLRSGITKNDFKSFVYALPLVILLLFFMGLSNYSLFVGIKDIFLWIMSPSLSKTSTVILTSIFTLGLGSALFYFRLRMRTIYGLTEAAIGIVVAGNRALSQIDQFVSTDFYLAILTASVYLIVRGFDNIHQGLIKEPIDPYGKKLFVFLQRRIPM
ncbi:MAG: hypothetical protein IPM51_06970 [Sphingobacteriaceae bacterium]|nr:hypothetical protein [Sphingobacteriaceae bacterium]